MLLVGSLACSLACSLARPSPNCTLRGRPCSAMHRRLAKAAAAQAHRANRHADRQTAGATGSAAATWFQWTDKRTHAWCQPVQAAGSKGGSRTRIARLVSCVLCENVKSVVLTKQTHFCCPQDKTFCIIR